MDAIREKLQRLYNSFNFKKAIENDPIKFLKRYNDHRDIEVAGIIASCFAYGKIECFCNFIDEILSVMGEKPSEFILNFEPFSFLERFKRRYRFNTIKDIVAFLFIIQNLLRNSPSKSLEYYFKNSTLSEQRKNLSPTVLKIFNFIQIALKVDVRPIYGKNIKNRGLLHFFPNPLKGSPCKRINLFLRWMVRNRDVDFGIWKGLKPNQLIIPLDIHIWRVSKKLGFTKRNSQSIRTAQEITDYLRKIDPEDPLKYDFVLCHGDINSLI